MAVWLLEDDGLPRHVVARAEVRGVALAHARQRGEAQRERGVCVGGYVEPGVVAVGLVELGDGLELAAAAHVVDERPQDVLLLLLPLLVLLHGVLGAGVEQQVGDEVVAGLGPLPRHAVVVVQPLDKDRERRVGQGGQDHGAHLLGGVVGPSAGRAWEGGHGDFRTFFEFFTRGVNM